MKKIIQIFIGFLVLFLLSSCYFYRDYYKPINPNVLCDYYGFGDVLYASEIPSTTELIEYGYDVPVFDDNKDSVMLVGCVTDENEEFWVFGATYGDEEFIIELEDFFVTTAKISSAIEIYNLDSDIDIMVGSIEDFTIGNLYAYGLLESSLADISPDILLVTIGSIKQYVDQSTFDIVYIVKYPNNTFKLISYSSYSLEITILYEFE